MDENKEQDNPEEIVRIIFGSFAKYGTILFAVILLICGIINLIMAPNSNAIGIIAICAIFLAIIIPLYSLMGVFKRK